MGLTSRLHRFDASAIAVAAPVVASMATAVVLHGLVDGALHERDALTYSAIASGLIGFEDPLFPAADRAWAIGGLGMRGVLYPLFVASVYGISGGIDPRAAEVAQAVVFLPATTLLVYLAGREAFSRRVGLIAAWLFALWLPAAWHTVWLLPETLVALLFVLLLALLAAAIRRGDPRLGLMAGIVAGVLSVSHSAYQALWLVLTLALLVHCALVAGRRMGVFARYWLGATSVVLCYFVFTLVADTPRLGEGAHGYGGGGMAGTSTIPMPRSVDAPASRRPKYGRANRPSCHIRIRSNDSGSATDQARGIRIRPRPRSSPATSFRSKPTPITCARRYRDGSPPMPRSSPPIPRSWTRSVHA